MKSWIFFFNYKSRKRSDWRSRLLGVKYFLPVMHHHHHQSDMFLPFFIYNDNHGKLPSIKSLLFFVLTLQIYGVAVVTHAHMIPLRNQALQLPTVILLLLVQTLFYFFIILLWPPFSKHKSAIVFRTGQANTSSFCFCVLEIFKLKCLKTKQHIMHKRSFHWLGRHRKQMDR